MQETLNYYEMLDVDYKASLDEIRKAYKALALKYHPDRHDEDQRQGNTSQNHFKRRF